MSDAPGLSARLRAAWRRRGVRELAWSLAGSGGQAVIGVATSILLARLLGPAGFGVFSVALATAFAVSGLADWGLSVAFTRIGSPEVMAGRSIRHLHSVFLALRLLVLVTLGAALVTAGPWVLPWLRLPPTFPWLAAAGAGAGVALGVGAHFASVLQVVRDQRALAMVRAGAGLVRLAAFVVVALAFPDPLIAVIAVALVSMLVETALLAVRAHRTTALWPLQLDTPPQAWVAFSLWVTLPAIAYSLIGQSDTLLMAALAGPVETGHWSAAARASGVLLLASSAVWSVALPYGTALTDRTHLARYLRLVRVGAVGLLLAAAMLVLVAPGLVAVAFGPSYLPAVPALRVLVAANACGALALVLVPLAYRLRRERTVALVGGLQFAINLGGDLLLIPRFGATGCAAATLLMQVVSLTVLGARLVADLRAGGPLPPALAAEPAS